MRTAVGDWDPRLSHGRKAARPSPSPSDAFLHPTGGDFLAR